MLFILIILVVIWLFVNYLIWDFFNIEVNDCKENLIIDSFFYVEFWFFLFFDYVLWYIKLLLKLIIVLFLVVLVLEYIK